MNRLVPLGLALVLGSLPPSAHQRALTIEDYYAIQTVGAVSISPTGHWVAYTVSTRVEDDNTTHTETQIVRTDGSAPPQRVMHYGQDVSNPRWAPDGWLLYTADREEWRVDAGKGTPPLKSVRLAAGSALSPDGKWVASLRDRAVPKTPTPAASEFERRHEDRFKGATFDWKDFQRDGQLFPSPNLRARPPAEIVVTPRAGGDAQVLTRTDIRPSGLAWHPDGRRLIFVADPDWRNELAYESPDLWLVTLDGVVTRLTDDAEVYSDAGFSPDGRYISFVRDPGTDLIIKEKRHHGGPSDLYIRPAAGGDAINLTAKWDLEPGPTRWSPDSRFIYFTGAIGGATHLFRASVPGGAVEQVTQGEKRLNGVTFDAHVTRIAYTVGLHEAPPDVYVAGIDGANERRLTNLHKDRTSEIAFGKGTRLRWPSKDGTEIEGWLILPHRYEAAKGPYPLVVTSHGGPHAATGYTFDFKKQYFAANGYFVLDTNFRGSTGYGEAFKWATWGAWGDRDGQDIIAGIDYVLARYPIDPRRVGHIGHSYGGFLTNWLITQYPDRFAAAVAGAGVANWISDYGTADIYRTKETEFFGAPWDKDARDRMIRQSPLTHAANVRTPTLFIHGEVDQRVPYEEAEQMYFALVRRGIPAKMIQYAGQPHGISGHWNNVHRMLNERKWFDRYLKVTTGPATSSR